MDLFFEKEYISARDAGKISGYAPDYVARLARTNRIEGRQIGRAWFVKRSSLESFIRESTGNQEKRKEMLARMREGEYRQARVALGLPVEVKAEKTLPTRPPVAPLSVPVSPPTPLPIRRSVSPLSHFVRGHLGSAAAFLVSFL